MATLIAALVLLAVGPSFAGEVIFDFSSGNNGGFSAAEFGVPNLWLFSGVDWRVDGANNMDRTLLSPTLTASGGPITVTMAHNVSFESYWDGAVLAMQVDGGPIERVTSFSRRWV